jgi:hypothetical protein
MCRLASSTAASVRALAKALGLVAGKSKSTGKSKDAGSKWAGLLS